MEAVLFYVVCKDQKEAEKIAQTLLKERLVACANILSPSSSFFWWNNKIDNEKEVPMILKTKKSLSKEIIQRIKQIHSYECPCIIALPIIDGYRDFLKWIEEETK